MNSGQAIPRSDAWSVTVLILLLGYLCMGRSFAYWGIPPLFLFVGELVLASFLLFGPHLSKGKWPWIARKLPKLKNVKRMLYLLLLYGAFEILHGIFAGYPAVTAIRDYAFDYYPLYLFLGLWVGLRGSFSLPKFFRVFGWVNGIYGVSYVLFLNRLSWTFPGFNDRAAPVAVFGTPEFSSIALLGLLVFEKDLREVWLLLVMNGFVLLGMQVRGEWLAFAVGLAIWAWLTRNFKRAVWGGALLVVLLAFMAVTSIQLPGIEARSAGSSITAGALLGRALSPVDSNLAYNYASNYQNDVDTTMFRTLWWAAILVAVHQSASSAIFGFGYGYPLGDLVPFLEGHYIQTPHNAFFYALSYGGWIGVIIFFWFLAEIGRLILAVPGSEMRNFGITLFAALFTIAMFEPFFETPYGAIPFFLLFGIIVSQALVIQRKSAPPAEHGVALLPPTAGA